MPKRFSSKNAWLSFALDLSRKNKLSMALSILRKVQMRGQLDFNCLRLAAQINIRCNELFAAELCWLEITQRNGMEPGDYYMLGSLQVRLNKLEFATQAFEQEIKMALFSGEDYFLTSSLINLANLKLRFGDLSGARSMLINLHDEVGDYFNNSGFLTKKDIIREIDILEIGRNI